MKTHHLGRVLSCLALVFLSLAGGASAAERELALTFETQAIVIDGVTPSGEIAVFSIARRQVSHHFAESMGRKFLLRDEEGTGRIRFDLGRAVEPTAVWAVVDIATGRQSIVTLGTSPTAARLPNGALKHSHGAQKAHLRIALPAAEVLVVRPGSGAWFAVAGDGGKLDSDGRADGGTSLETEQLEDAKAKEKKKLAKFRKGDVVIAIDPRSLRWFSSTEIGEE